MAAAIDGDHLAIDVAHMIGHQKARQIGQFDVFADPSRRIAQSFGITPARAQLAQAPGVGNGPGAMPTRRIPLGPHSTARLRIMARWADFAIAEGTVKARPVMVDVDKMPSATPGRC